MPRGWSDAWEGNWNTDDDPGVVRLAMLDDAEDDAGALVAVNHTGLKRKARSKLPPRIKHARLEELS